MFEAVLERIEEMITLKRPIKEYENEAKAFKQEFFDNKETTINGSELLDQMDSYDEWLKSVTANTSPDTVNPTWVVTDTYFALDENDSIVGIIDLRHELNDFLKDFGNCGYSVRPSQRRKGYATEMLKLILERACQVGMDKLQLSVERSNEASVKTITKNGGKYERSFTFEGEEADVYMIRLESVVYDTATISDIPELVRLRILYMIDDFGSITDEERESMETQLPGYFERELGKKLIAFVARSEGRLVAAAYLLIIEKPANPFLPNGFDSEVLSVYTEEKYRGRGICTRLMSNMIEYSKKHQICRIDLVATDEGYPIYKKLGFGDKVQKYRDMRLNLLQD